METRILHRSEIDDHRWNEVISRASCETLYPYSWYLDAAASRWSALVAGDYRLVMPLVWKRKYGLRFLYQPYHTQQLGIFSEEAADPEQVAFMLSRAMKGFCFGTIQLNAGNLVREDLGCRVEERSNHIIDLRLDYDRLSAAYSTNTRRNLKKALETGMQVEQGISCEELVALKRANDVTGRGEEGYTRLIRLMETIMANAGGAVYGVRDGGQLEAAAFFGFSRRRAIYLVSVSGDRGKERRCMFGIVDAFIREHAGSGRMLDFEGSSIPSIARFFEGFGGAPEVYRRVRFSRLPIIGNKPGGDG